MNFLAVEERGGGRLDIGVRSAREVGGCSCTSACG